MYRISPRCVKRRPRWCTQRQPIAPPVSNRGSRPITNTTTPTCSVSRASASSAANVGLMGFMRRWYGRTKKPPAHKALAAAAHGLPRQAARHRTLALFGGVDLHVVRDHVPAVLLQLRQARGVAAQALGGAEGHLGAAEDVGRDLHGVHGLDE